MDPNIVLRYLTGDDPEQVPKAFRPLERPDLAEMYMFDQVEGEDAAAAWVIKRIR